MAESRPRSISIEAAGDDPFVDHALELCSRFLGVTWRRVDPARRSDGPDVVDVYYGPDASRPCRLRIPRAPSYGEEDVPLPEPSGRPRPGPGEPFPFDVFEALRFWLGDAGNAHAPDSSFDPHGRLITQHSAQERLGVREAAPANACMLLFGAWLEARTQVPLQSPLAGNRRCAVILSHDVDDPVDPGDLGYTLRLAARTALAGGWLRWPWRHRAWYARSLADRLGHRGDRHWVFDEVIEAEERHGFRSTFFFASTPHDRRGAAYFDVGYDVRHGRFAPVFRRIAESGSEVGLHISYNARESFERIAAEREALEGACGAPVLGSRHHYWHMRRPFWSTLHDHARAGLRYDASIAFNDAPGLRLGIAFPFRPWDPSEGRAADTLQLPTILMDGVLFRDGRASVEGAVKRVAALVDALKQHRGVASFDWHARTSWPGSTRFRKHGETYLEVLALLAGDPEVEVLCCREALERFGPRAPAGDGGR